MMSSFIPGTGLPGTGLDNQPAEEQQLPSKLKSNFELGLTNTVDPNNNPFNTNPQSQGGNTQGGNSQANNNQPLISDLNMGVDATMINSNTNPTPVNFGNTDFTNSGFQNTNPQSQHVDFNSTPQVIPGSIHVPSNAFQKPHSVQPKEFTPNQFGEIGQDFPKAPEFNLGGTYDWNYYPKLISADLDAKLAVLRKVGP